VKYGFSQGAEDFPRMVVLNLDFTCNARCIHCPYTNSGIRQESRALKYKFMSEEIFKKIASQAGEHNSFIRISAAGEPLLHPKLLSLIEYAKIKGCGIGLITNGSLVTQEVSDKLLEMNIENIEFSADAHDKVTYEKIRIGLNWDDFLANIKYFRKRRDELKTNTNIIISAVNQKLISKDIEKIKKFWSGLADEVQIRKYLSWGINLKEKSGDAIPYLENNTPCPIPFDRMFFDTNGDVRMCIYDIKGKTNYGNVLKKTIKQIWQGKEFTALREVHLKREFHKNPTCQNCWDRQFRSWEYNYFHLTQEAKRKRNSKNSAVGKHVKVKKN